MDLGECLPLAISSDACPCNRDGQSQVVRIGYVPSEAPRARLACSPKPGPCVMRVSRASVGKENLDETEATQPGQIIKKLHKADAMIAQGKTIGQASSDRERPLR